MIRKQEVIGNISLFSRLLVHSIVDIVGNSFECVSGSI